MLRQTVNLLRFCPNTERSTGTSGPDEAGSWPSTGWISVSRQHRFSKSRLTLRWSEGQRMLGLEEKVQRQLRSIKLSITEPLSGQSRVNIQL